MESNRLDEILDRLPACRIAVVGDYFLDRYFDIDRSLSETSLETNLEAYQIVNVRCYPGAAGTVTNNLAALGVGEIYAVGAIGDDGEGYELRRGLEQTGVRLDTLLTAAEMRTPTYTKPMVRDPGRAPREIERLDIKNREPLPAPVEKAVVGLLHEIINRVDGMIVIEQVVEQNHGIITERVRDALAALGLSHPEMRILADSRARIAEFRHMMIKPNRREALRAAGAEDRRGSGQDPLPEAAARLGQKIGKPVFVTDGPSGIYVASGGSVERVHAFHPHGPIDIVGAGDSVNASIMAALCAGAELREAALIGNLVGSITIEQIGVTGTAAPDDVRRRLAEYQAQQKD